MMKRAKSNRVFSLSVEHLASKANLVEQRDHAVWEYQNVAVRMAAVCVCLANDLCRQCYESVFHIYVPSIDPDLARALLC